MISQMALYQDRTVKRIENKFSLRILIKHAGSQLKTRETLFPTWDQAANYAKMWIENQFVDLEFHEPPVWRWKCDDGQIAWCDRIVIPSDQDEAHFLFRISIKEVAVVPGS